MAEQLTRQDRSTGEFASHTLLARHSLAPPLLGRFQNGLLYRYMRGQVCTASDLGREAVWRAVARRLGEWHAVLPIVAKDDCTAVHDNGQDVSLPAPDGASSNGDGPHVNGVLRHLHRKVEPNLWTVMQQWVSVLPESSPADSKRKLVLQKEAQRLTYELYNVSTLGDDGVSAPFNPSGPCPEPAPACLCPL